MVALLGTIGEKLGAKTFPAYEQWAKTEPLLLKVRSGCPPGLEIERAFEGILSHLLTWLLRKRPQLFMEWLRDSVRGKFFLITRQVRNISFLSTAGEEAANRLGDRLRRGK